MSETANLSSPSQHTGRPHTLPPTPSGERVEAEIGAEVPGILGFVLWRLARDVKLWGETEETGRSSLFHPPQRSREREWLVQAMRTAPELVGSLEQLFVLVRFPGFAEKGRIAQACRTISEWASQRQRLETAIQFAEAAAAADPDDPKAASDAGQACQRAADVPRAIAWFQRAIVLARRAPDWMWYVRTYLRLGYLHVEMGSVEAAKPLYLRAWRTAKRTGRKSLGASAQHDLFTLALLADDFDTAHKHAALALELYPIFHPAVPRFALDYTSLLIRMGLYTRARYILEVCEPLWRSHQLRMVGLGNLALASARLGDRARYDSLVVQVRELARANEDFAALALMQAADGARLFGLWAQGESLAAQAMDIARRRNESGAYERAAEIMDRINLRLFGDWPRDPDDPGESQEISRQIIRRLKRQRDRA